MNKVSLIGNMTRDPEMRYTASGVAVANFGLALNRSYKRGDEWDEETTFLECEAWTFVAEQIDRRGKKGCKIAIDGRLKLDEWETDGMKRSKIKVVCERVEIFNVERQPRIDSDQEPAQEPKPNNDDDMPF